jgi:ABC-type phosphate transport system auxiliary subunit
MNGNQECEAYAEHLQAEHRELHQRLRAMQAELNNVADKLIDEALLARMLDGGEQLRSDLMHHFDEEENGGCMEYAVSRVPALSPEARDLEHEHPQIIAQLDRLLMNLRKARPNEMLVAAVKEQFDAIVVRLLAHEARENRLIERGFNMPLD